MPGNQSYASNYIKIYLWQGLSIATSFLSMFVVVPQISSRPTLFGIYSICMSVTVFVTYADFGFMSSGFRYANESFANNDRQREVATVGFVSFILSMFVLVYALGVIAVAVHPQYLIANLADAAEASIASMLLVWLAVFSPMIVVQRMLQLIYGVRIEDYIYQRINTTSNLIKIAGVFLFVNSSGYDIVGYFVMCQAVTAIGLIASIAVARTRYQYDLVLLARSIRFDKDIFDSTRRVALSSMYVTLAWVLYNELDMLFLGRALGADKLAVYAVAFGLVSFFRTLSSTIFLPFQARIHQLAAVHDDARLRSYYRRVMIVALPAVVFPVLSLFMLMKPFVLSWVGSQYSGSITIAQVLILAYGGTFISVPASFLLVAQQRVRPLYLVGSGAPIVLWGGVTIAFMLGTLSTMTFAAFKLLGAIPLQAISLTLSSRYLRMSGFQFIRQIIGPALLPCAFLVGLLWYLSPFLPTDKKPVNVMLTVAAGGAASGLAVGIYYWGSITFREELSRLLNRRSFWRSDPQPA